jgi:hypothetical protein
MGEMIMLWLTMVERDSSIVRNRRTANGKRKRVGELLFVEEGASCDMNLRQRYLHRRRALNLNCCLLIRAERGWASGIEAFVKSLCLVTLCMLHALPQRR